MNEKEAIYTGKPVALALGKWYAKFRTGKFRPGIAFTMYESVRKTKDGFEVMEYGFLFGIFRPEKQNY